MSSETTFHSTKEALQVLLRDIGLGKIQLPDFQRGWIWDEEHVKGILASISLSYPIGSVMMLGTGNPKVRLKPRLLEGVDVSLHTAPDELILDGQQRLTSLFQALYSNRIVETKDGRGKPMRRWYYIDIRKMLSVNGEREEAIVGLPEDRMLRNFRGEIIADYSTREKECGAELFPLTLVFNTVEQTKWQMQYLSTDPHL